MVKAAMKFNSVTTFLSLFLVSWCWRALLALRPPIPTKTRHHGCSFRLSPTSTSSVPRPASSSSRIISTVIGATTDPQLFSQSPQRKRDRLFSRTKGLFSNGSNQESTFQPPQIAMVEITTVAELDEYWDDSKMMPDTKATLAKLSVKGDTQIIGSPDHADFVHPVVKVLHDRRRRQGTAASRAKATSATEKTQKIALVIEGGGMRGCVTAGMVCAINYLGLRDCVDVVYGSSAGSIIGAYFITGQLPWFGPEVYYDQLPVAGKSFIDPGRLLRALGLGLLNPRLLKDVLTRPNAGKPVLNLDYLLKDTLQTSKPLDWDAFVQRQQVQPLRVVASAMKSERAFAMDYEHGHFTSLEEMAQCMHASCLLPGIAGPVANILNSANPPQTQKPKFVMRNDFKDADYEPLADALIYAPIAYDLALEDGATHLVVLRSKPDGGDVIGKGGSIGEKLVWFRFFLRKNKLSRMYNRLTQQLHKRLYARNVLELNAAAKVSASSRLPPTLTVALPPGQKEITRLETSREAIFEGVRQGFARAYDTLVEDPGERGRGYEVATSFFPDEILDYSPEKLRELGGDGTASAFETYLAETGIWPKAWEGLSEAPIKYKGYAQEDVSSPLSSAPAETAAKSASVETATKPEQKTA